MLSEHNEEHKEEISEKSLIWLTLVSPYQAANLIACKLLSKIPVNHGSQFTYYSY